MTVRVGIIDSGLPDGTVRAGDSSTRLLRDFTTDQCVVDRLGHGSAVHSIISAVPGVEIITAKIFADRLSCGLATLIAAIDWMSEQSVHLVNMSFGMIRGSEDLTRAVATLLDSGAHCIAAAPAQGDPVYPSSLPQVIRATGDARCVPDTLSWLDSAQADFGGHPGVPGAGPAGASVGCAHVTRVAARLLGKGDTLASGNLVSALQQFAHWQGPERRSGPP